MAERKKKTITDEVTGEEIVVEVHEEAEEENANEERGYNGVYTLKKPIMINDKECKEIPYDFEELTGRDMVRISRDLKDKGVMVLISQLDDEYLLNLFAKAVARKTKGIALMDLLRMSVRDVAEVNRLARNFLQAKDTSKSEEDDL